MTFTPPDKLSTTQLVQMAEYLRKIIETRDADLALEVVEMTLKDVEAYIVTHRSAS